MEEKLMISNLLTSTKNLCDILMHATIESTKNYNVFKESLNSYLELQNNLATIMTEQGWYQLEIVDQTKIEQAKTKYCN